MADLKPATEWAERPDGTVITGFGKELEPLSNITSNRARKRNSALVRVFGGDGVPQRVVVQWGAAALAKLGSQEEVAAFTTGVAKMPGLKSALQVRVRAIAEAEVVPEPTAEAI